ncbi:hypothetical protein Celaphus_00000723 [Cervus elaphus hippelaphus]|uniref:Protein Njmu-R1 n=1 Tax=Cervus elaphus hippelaphus TaxID=46360 RepID=A0A212DAF9_CEREH|nr:hypothetical protein Celaphus_00000723 [Cervus elaphus hippelaphus]
MLPSLQESLDGDEKELESSEEGGSAEERRLDPPPSSHYCLYSYRGSRCSARPPLWPRPGPAARPRSPLRVPQLGGSQTPSSPLPAKVSGPQGPPRLTPYFPAPNPGLLRLVLPCLSAVSLTSEKPLPVTSAFCLAQCFARSIKVAQQRADSDDGSPGGTNAETPSGDDFSLSLVDTNLPSEVEPELRSFIAKRLSKGAVFEGLGNVAAVELRIPGYRVGCYYCLFQQEKPLPQTASMDSEQKSSEYVVCFLGGSEKGLELYPFFEHTFRLELDKYIQGLKNNMNCEESGGENHIQSYLSSWFADVVCPIQRVVHLFQEKLTFLLHAVSIAQTKALSYTPVEVKGSDEKTKRDIHRFLSVASLQGLIHEGTMTSLCMAMTEEQHKSVIIDCSSSQPQFHNAVLENFKLKAIQDTNNLKRFIRQAEMNHYALFKCYMFLKNCGSGDILLKIVKVEHEEMPEAKNVVAVLEEFMKEAPAQSF